MDCIFMFSNDDTYLDNIFNNNGSGVAVMHSRRVIMLNNEFRENWEALLLVSF